MEVSNIPKLNHKKIESVSDLKSSEKTRNSAELENALNPKTEVTISEEGRELQTTDDTEILKMPEQTDGNKIYQNISDTKTNLVQQNKRNKMNQIAAKIMSGKKVSYAEEKILKEIDPQLYARIKAKAALTNH